MLKPENAEQALKLIEELKQEFQLHGLVWGDKEIIETLDEENREHQGNFPKDFYPHIIREVKNSEEWSKVNWTYDASDVWIELSAVVRKVARRVVAQEAQNSVTNITLDDFTNDQIVVFIRNKDDSDKNVAKLMGTVPSKVRGLRKFMDEAIAAGMEGK